MAAPEAGQGQLEVLHTSNSGLLDLGFKLTNTLVSLLILLMLWRGQPVTPPVITPGPDQRPVIVNPQPKPPQPTPQPVVSVGEQCRLAGAAYWHDVAAGYAELALNPPLNVRDAAKRQKVVDAAAWAKCVQAFAAAQEPALGSGDLTPEQARQVFGSMAAELSKIK